LVRGGERQNRRAHLLHGGDDGLHERGALIGCVAQLAEGPEHVAELARLQHAGMCLARDHRQQLRVAVCCLNLFQRGLRMACSMRA
jgi:hypothetical protein